MSSIYDPRYKKLITELRRFREDAGTTQNDLGNRLSEHQSYIAKVEGLERRLDVIELKDWLTALGYDFHSFLIKVGLVELDDDAEITMAYTGDIAVPVAGKVLTHADGVEQILISKGETRKVVLKGITVDQYLLVEKQVADIFRALNKPKTKLKNRDAIAKALKIAFDELPNLNPSDVYQHIVYRLYIREYFASNAEQSWKRASGDAMEIFIVEKYTPVLLPHGIKLSALNANKKACVAALTAMGIQNSVGSAKLDIALYGKYEGEYKIFGGVHCKASLAERVTDDVPCSTAMMAKGYYSYLYTFDSKSFPHILFNFGELGRDGGTSDKRKYVEEHGHFDFMFSYNTNGTSSPETTNSGKKILVSSLRAEEDPFPNKVIDAWDRFKKSL